MITVEQKQDLWEKLHECHAIATVTARAIEFEDTSDIREPFPSASYVGCLQRISTVLADVILTLDNLPDKTD